MEVARPATGAPLNRLTPPAEGRRPIFSNEGRPQGQHPLGHLLGLEGAVVSMPRPPDALRPMFVIRRAAAPRSSASCRHDHPRHPPRGWSPTGPDAFSRPSVWRPGDLRCSPPPATRCAPRCRAHGRARSRSTPSRGSPAQPFASFLWIRSAALSAYRLWRRPDTGGWPWDPVDDAGVRRPSSSTRCCSSGARRSPTGRRRALARRQRRGAALAPHRTDGINLITSPARSPYPGRAGRLPSSTNSFALVHDARSPTRSPAHARRHRGAERRGRPGPGELTAGRRPATFAFAWAGARATATLQREPGGWPRTSPPGASPPSGPSALRCRACRGRRGRPAPGDAPAGILTDPEEWRRAAARRGRRRGRPAPGRVPRGPRRPGAARRRTARARRPGLQWAVWCECPYRGQPNVRDPAIPRTTGGLPPARGPGLRHASSPPRAVDDERPSAIRALA